MAEIVSINISKEYALKLAQYLSDLQLGEDLHYSSVEEFDLMREITGEVLNQIVDALPASFPKIYPVRTEIAK